MGSVGKLNWWAHYEGQVQYKQVKPKEKTWLLWRLNQMFI